MRGYVLERADDGVGANFSVNTNGTRGFVEFVLDEAHYVVY